MQGRLLLALTFARVSKPILAVLGSWLTRLDILHGFVFSLFFDRWLDASGSKNTFVAVGGIQLACLSFSIPIYIYGKRARLWTSRRGLLERF